jgi:hypothetical protein
MAALAAELSRLHVLDRAIRQLGPDHDVRDRGDPQEPEEPPESRGAVEGRACGKAPLGEHRPQRDQREADEEQYGQDQEEDDSRVRVIDVAPRLRGQGEQPEEPGRRDQDSAGQAQPVAGQQNGDRTRRARAQNE